MKAQNNESSIIKRLSSPAETEAFAKRLVPLLKEGDLLLFTGAIGAGKTTFIQFLAKYLGVKENVTSPSFVLHALYESGRVPLSHVDFYRLNSDAEVESIGFEDYYDTHITVVEWADRYSCFIPPYLKLNFAYLENENERLLTITPVGKEWSDRLATLD
ncbi:MAG: tRNA (adenosine(37)-N6)-threonylcarbamoyltransferase complex ATPase subunit type 1 TsaE [Oscillospiraceae bacterium]|nr:tRNA (adenosine(37)-N6)-threonylcarbamoyltransferase complex ATPase subunit type 1 TsaE [Oscillospiraceae bacterium]